VKLFETLVSLYNKNKKIRVRYKKVTPREVFSLSTRKNPVETMKRTPRQIEL